MNPQKKKRKKSFGPTVRTGTRTQNLLLRRQAPYPLGHTDNYEMLLVDSRNRTRHSSLGVEHSLSKRKVVGSNPACGCAERLDEAPFFLGGFGFVSQSAGTLSFQSNLRRKAQKERRHLRTRSSTQVRLFLREGKRDASRGEAFGWCSWLSRQSNTLKVPSSILGSNSSFCTSRVSPVDLFAFQSVWCLFGFQRNRTKDEVVTPT